MNGIPLNYQNQTCAWVFGGNNILFDGFNEGTFDGNGQLWYAYSVCIICRRQYDYQVRLYKGCLEFARSTHQFYYQCHKSLRISKSALYSIAVLDYGC
jgi:hypothetical protein